MAQRDTGPLFSFFVAVPLCAKNGEEGHRAFFFSFLRRCPSTSKAAPLCIKNEAEWSGTGPFFVIYKAVSRCIKNDAEGHRAFLVKHRDASRPRKVNRVRSAERVLTPLSGILGTPMPARTERKWKCSEAPFMGL